MVQLTQPEPDQSGPDVFRMLSGTTSWQGESINFNATVKSLPHSRKWCVSSITNKLFIGRNISFPLQISVNRHVNADIVLCPVFVDPSNTLSPVFRCINCKMADPNPTIGQHIVQVEANNAAYFSLEGHHMARLPLGLPPPGEDSSSIFIKFGCRTSCVGGPNRKPFNLVVLLIDQCWKVLARKIINVKVCESAERDMKNEDKAFMNQALNGMNMLDDTKIKLEQIADQLNTSKKRKLNSNTEESVPLLVPKRFLKKMQNYLAFLNYEQARKANLSSDESEC